MDGGGDAVVGEGDADKRGQETDAGWLIPQIFDVPSGRMVPCRGAAAKDVCLLSVDQDRELQANRRLAPDRSWERRYNRSFKLDNPMGSRL